SCSCHVCLSLGAILASPRRRSRNGEHRSTRADRARATGPAAGARRPKARREDRLRRRPVPFSPDASTNFPLSASVRLPTVKADRNGNKNAEKRTEGPRMKSLNRPLPPIRCEGCSILVGPGYLSKQG